MFGRSRVKSGGGKRGGHGDRVPRNGDVGQGVGSVLPESGGFRRPPLRYQHRSACGIRFARRLEDANTQRWPARGDAPPRAPSTRGRRHDAAGSKPASRRLSAPPRGPVRTAEWVHAEVRRRGGNSERDAVNKHACSTIKLWRLRPYLIPFALSLSKGPFCRLRLGRRERASTSPARTDLETGSD